MAVLEKIRSKTVFLIAIIGLALFAFIISDFIGKGRFSNHQPNEIGSVNGEDVPIGSFRQQVENAVHQAGGKASSIEAAKYVWEQNVQRILLKQQIEKLGLSVEKDQILNILSKNQMLASNPQFANEYGVFDASKFTAYLANLKATKPNEYAMWLMQEDAIIEGAKEEMYFSLIRAGLGVTNAEAEMAYHEEKDMADISYVALQYSSIEDKDVTVTDNEIKDYIKKHEKQFKQEAYRNIQYVVVTQKPSEADKEAEKESILKVLQPEIVFNSQTNSNDTIAGFAATKDIQEFVNRRSDTPYDTLYVTKDNLKSAYADTLFALPVGKIYGPYEEEGSLKISKMVGKRANGAVKASHILIAYTGSQAANAATTRTKEEAKAKAEELLAEAKKGTDFSMLAAQNSDEPNANYSGGSLGFFTRGMMVKPFNDYVFANPVGSIGLVETDFGYHVVKIEDRADVVNIATISRKVEPSDATVNDLYSKVSNFQLKATENPKEFANIAKEADLSVLRADNLHKIDDQIIGLGSNRAIVQWLFQKDTKVGAVKMFTSGDDYIVAQLVKQGEEGISEVQDVAPFVKPILIREKKAAMLAEKAKGASLEAIASANKVEVKTATGLTMNSPIIIGEGREPKVVGAAFGLKQGAISKPIEGENGVYVVQLTSATIAPASEDYKTYVETIEKLRTNRAGQGILKSLENNAKIKENLSLFY